MRIRVPGRVFLATVIVASCGWLAFYAHGALARDADKIMAGQVNRGNFSGTVLVSQAGKVLFAQAYVRAKHGSTPDLELLAESEDAFFIRGSDTDISVLENGKGEVEGLSANLRDAAYFAKKLR
jgi:hypothetical protein